MKTNPRYRPRFDRLENRMCPALAWQQIGGVLLISGVPTSGSVLVQETGVGSIVVHDGTRAAAFTSVSSLSVSLGAGNDTVMIDLGGNTLAGAISAGFVGGTNALTIEYGTAGLVNLWGGSGANRIALGDGGRLLRVSSNTTVTLAGNAADTLTVANNVRLAGNLTVSSAATVNINTGSTIGQSATFYAAATGTVVADAATVTLDVTYYGTYGIAAGQDTLMVNGAVGRNLTFSSPYLNWVGNEADVNANVGGNVLIASAGLTDRVTVAPLVDIHGNFTAAFAGGSGTLNVADYSIIEGGALIALGNGSRSVSFGATVGNNTNALVFAVYGGIGNETVTFSAAATFRGQGVVSLSSYSRNTVSFVSPKAFNTYAFVIDGGYGGINTLNLRGTQGTKLGYRDFTYVYR